MFKILETARDAIQGLEKIIPTKDKVRLINSMLQVGFDIIDVGSFVSPKAIPQMADTAKVLDNIDLSTTKTKIFTLVATVRGGQNAAQFDQVDFIGYPFSTSETFLKKNINSNFIKAENTIDELQNFCVKTGKKLMLYFSMAFGNPYNDPVNAEIILYWTEKFRRKGISFISLSDIISSATPEMIDSIYGALSKEFPEITFGLHLHVKPNESGYEKIDMAYKNGCSIFEGVINGLGGCPMTGYELIGNLPTGNILSYAEKNNISTGINHNKFEQARLLAMEIL